MSMEGKDSRRKIKFQKSKAHFDKAKNVARTKKDMEIPRIKPAEDRGRFEGGRKENKHIAHETMKIIQNRCYINMRNENVSLESMLSNMSSITYTPSKDLDISKIHKKYENTEFVVQKESTLNSYFMEDRKNKENFLSYLENIEYVDVRQEKIFEDKICILNFASARNPGGGFLSGSSSQEETLAKCSALYESIYESDMYIVNDKDNNNCLYSHYMIYSKNVPVFRDDEMELLTVPSKVDFITSPAVNCKEALKRGITQQTINETMNERMDRLFSVCVLNGVDILILGAWGCGVFGGDYKIVSSQFMYWLTTKYRGYFKKIIFAVFSDEDYATMKMIDYEVTFV